jgi:prepilin-type N-terminal cleavage/methylation domain-containing protein
MKMKKGVTLLEIIVSTIILSIVMLGLANIFVIAKRYSQHTRSKIQAAEVSRFFLDPLQAQVRNDEWDSNCLGTGNCLGMCASQWLNNINYQVTYCITDVAATPTVRRVKITLDWNEPAP